MSIETLPLAEQASESLGQVTVTSRSVAYMATITERASYGPREVCTVTADRNPPPRAGCTRPEPIEISGGGRSREMSLTVEQARALGAALIAAADALS